jgi:cell division initiation protein
MKISPMDIQRHGFDRRLRGFDRDEVRAFLAVVAEEVAGLQREKDLIEQRVRELELLVSEHRESARREADTVVKQAEIQGDRLLELAQGRAHEVERGILELRAHRTALRTDVRALIKRLTAILDLQEEAELEDNLRFLKRREEASGAG